MRDKLSIKRVQQFLSLADNSSEAKKLSLIWEDGFSQQKTIDKNDLTSIIQKLKLTPKITQPMVVSLFVTKGGVLKSSLSLNLARIAALYGIKTCVVGLDMQGDISSALSQEELPEDSDLSGALTQLEHIYGLNDVFLGQKTIDEVLKPTDLNHLFYIPETPELIALDQSLVNRNRREYWLRDHVIQPLKNKFDFIILDCSPNWNRLITNALVASDLLISPIECKVNNFRNLRTFQALMENFKKEMGITLQHLYVPTKLSSSKRLSREIADWYWQNIKNCSPIAIRESNQGEEATAMKLSVLEYAPSSDSALEMKQLFLQVFATTKNSAKETAVWQ